METVLVRSLAALGVKRRELEHVQLLPNVRQVVPFREIAYGVRYFDRAESVRLIGTTETAIDVTRLQMQSGRFFKKKELLTRNNVIVIGRGLAKTLLRGINSVGKSLIIGNRYYLIIGVTSSQQKPVNGLEVYLPITRMISKFGDLDIVRSLGSFSVNQFETSYVVVTVKNQARREQTVEQIQEILKRFHGKKKVYTVKQTSGTTGR
jgi:hypothetical protein